MTDLDDEIDKLFREACLEYDPVKRLDLYNTALALDPLAARMYFYRGSCYQDLKRLPEALADFSKAIELAPLWDELYVARINVNFALGETDLVEEDKDTILAMDSGTMDNPVNRGYIALERGLHDEAIEDAKAALWHNSHHWAAYDLGGRAYLAKGDLKAAVKEFTAAIKPANEDQIPFLELRADAYDKLIQPDKALKDRMRIDKIKENG